MSDDAWRVEDRDDTSSQAEDDTWDAFIAAINPADVERERYRPPTEHERPHSPEDIRMRSRHHQVVTAFYIAKAGHVVGPFAPLEALEARLHRDREAQIAAYAARKKAAA